MLNFALVLMDCVGLICLFDLYSGMWLLRIPNSSFELPT